MTVSGFTIIRAALQRDQELTERRPEQSVQRVQHWPRPLPFEGGDLLSESEDLQAEIAAGPEEDAQGGQQCEGEVDHETTLITPAILTGTR